MAAKRKISGAKSNPRSVTKASSKYKSRKTSAATGGTKRTGKGNATRAGSATRTRTAKESKSTTVDINYDNRKGYDPKFLGRKSVVPIPSLNSDQLKEVARQKSGSNGMPDYVLPYHHFSIVVNGKRKIALFTACNIAGEVWEQIKREDDNWIFDKRIAESMQIGNKFYKKSIFNRGHLVRRQDPDWGTRKEAQEANNDTFHFTNCSPQQSEFNQRAKFWAGLENYILRNATNFDLRLCLFTGPVLRSDDPPSRGELVPRKYWKVAVIIKKNGYLSATAYLMSQEDMLPSVLEAEFVYGAYKTYQVSIQRIENLTGLNFGQLSQFDPLMKTPGKVLTSAHLAEPVKALRSYKDIVL